MSKISQNESFYMLARLQLVIKFRKDLSIANISLRRFPIQWSIKLGVHCHTFFNTRIYFCNLYSFSFILIIFNTHWKAICLYIVMNVYTWFFSHFILYFQVSKEHLLLLSTLWNFKGKTCKSMWLMFGFLLFRPRVLFRMFFRGPPKLLIC